MSKGKKRSGARPGRPQPLRGTKGKRKGARLWRSEERVSRNAETELVCRLLLEKKNSVLAEHDLLRLVTCPAHQLPLPRAPERPDGESQRLFEHSNRSDHD